MARCSRCHCPATCTAQIQSQRPQGSEATGAHTRSYSTTSCLSYMYARLRTHAFHCCVHIHTDKPLYTDAHYCIHIHIHRQLYTTCHHCIHIHTCTLYPHSSLLCTCTHIYALVHTHFTTVRMYIHNTLVPPHAIYSCVHIRTYMSLHTYFITIYMNIYIYFITVHLYTHTILLRTYTHISVLVHIYSTTVYIYMCIYTCTHTPTAPLCSCMYKIHLFPYAHMTEVPCV